MPETTWRHTIRLADVFHDDTRTFEQRRDVIVARLRASEWFASPGQGSDLPEIVDELADAESTSDFEAAWAALYDEADLDRVWIATR